MAENIYLSIFKKMLKKITSIFLLFFLLFLILQSVLYSAVIKQQVNFSPNNISTWIQNTSTFNQDIRTNNTPGLEWPKGSQKFAIFTSGLCIGAYVNGAIRLGNASYNGEYAPGYVGDSSGIPIFKTNSHFKLYSVRYNDNRYSNPDIVNWKNMIMYGAPFNDINNNKIYDDGIDIPGMPDAVQTIFLCCTDADVSNHTGSEGFSGGTKPVNAEVHMTAWGYDLEPINNVQFFRWNIINKNDTAWKGTYFTLISDPDLGEALDDYLGCDTTLQMAYCYNGINFDGTGSGRTYGLNPPAVGQMFIRGAVVKNNSSTDTLNMTSSIYFSNPSSGEIVCEQDPSGDQSQAYNYMKGFKKDGTPWLCPLTNPYSTTKFCYSGNPEDSTGWTERKGRIWNCGGNQTGVLAASNPGNRRSILTTGSELLTVNPGDTQNIVMAQMITRGNNHLNAVTKLKELASLTRRVYFQAIEETETYYTDPPAQLPTDYKLFQNFPNPFNPLTTIRYEMKKLWKVKIQIYDTRGELIKTLVNEEKPQGVYKIKFDASNLPSGIYFIKMTSGEGFEDSKKMVVIK